MRKVVASSIAPGISAGFSSGSAGPIGIRTPIGWQTMLADLSLILFMVTAAAMADKPAAPPRPPAVAAAGRSAKALADPARAEPLAIWNDGPGAPALSEWLATQAPDPRQQLTITLRYRPGNLKAATARAEALLREAGDSGASARIIVEPLPTVAAKARAGAAGFDEATASLAYDRAPDSHG